MTVAVSARSATYLEDGVSKSFIVPFRFRDPADILAERRYPDGSVVPLTYGLHYSVAGGATDAGGTLTTVSAAPAGVKLVVLGQTARSQKADYATGDHFPAASHEDQLDRLSMVTQETDREIARTLRMQRGLAAPEVGAVANGEVLALSDGRLKGLSVDDFSASARQYRDQAAAFATALVTYTFGYIGIDDPAPPSDIEVGDGYIYTQSSRVYGAVKTGSTTGDVKFEILTVAAGANIEYDWSASYPAQSIGAKLQETVSVRDEGAVADGSTNDAAAFISVPGALIPAGNYYIGSEVNSEFDFSQGVTLSGPLAGTVYPKGLRSGNSNYFIATFTNNASMSNRHLTTHVSSDGVHFRQIGYYDTDFAGVPWNFGDASLFYHDGVWYAPFTDHDTDDHDFCVARSRNLNDWEVVKCKLGNTGVCVTNGSAPGWSHAFLTGPKLWAPKLFEAADGSIYVSVSIQTQADQLSIDAPSTFFFRQFYARCTDLASLTFAAAVELQIDGTKGPSTASEATENRIDGDILQLPGGGWAMAIKDEYSRAINLCTCASLSGDWITTATNIAPLNGAGVPYTEGPGITPVYRNGLAYYRIYLDKYDDGTQYYVETSDFASVGSPVAVQNECMIRHGRVLNLGHLRRADMASAVATIEKSQGFFAKPSRSGIKRIVNLKNVSGFPTISNFAPVNGTLYRLYYDGTNFDVAISSFASPASAPEGSYFYLSVHAGNGGLNQTPTRITIAAGAANFAPNTVPLILGQHLGTADMLVKFVMTENAWRMESCGPTDLLGAKIAGKIQALAAVTNFPAINDGNTAFWPNAGAVYSTDGSSTYASATTIHSLPLAYPDGTRIGFAVYSATSNGDIVLKAGAHARWPTDITIDSADNGKVVEIMMVGGKWSLVR